MAQKLNQGIIESVSGDIIHNKITISEQPQVGLFLSRNHYHFAKMIGNKKLNFMP